MKVSNKIRRVLFGGAFALIILALILSAFFLPQGTPPVAPLPNPNGYDDFIAADKLLPHASWDWDNLDFDQLKTALATNRPALALARRGLTKKSQVPTDYTPTFFENRSQELGASKHLAMAFRADGKLAEIEGRFDDAANDYASIIAVGIEANHGGFLIHSLVQVAVESIGTKRFQLIVSNLSSQGSRQSLEALQKAEADRDSFDKFKAQEHLFYLHTPLKAKIEDLRRRLIGQDDIAIAEAKTEKKYLTSQLAILNLEAELAAHAFELDKGRAATNWNDIVPAYLPVIPNDPTTNQPLVFSP